MEEAHRAGGDRLRRVDVAVLAVAAAVGVGLRAWVLRSPLGVLDSDEAIVGLMARRLAFRGEWRAFYWGQPYGGTIEPILTAAVVKAVGSGVLAVKAVPLVLCGVATGLLALVGRRVVGLRRGLYVAAAFWLANGNLVWWSTKSRGFYWATLVLGLVVVLQALRLDEDGRRWGSWAVLGLAAGLGWWTSPQILFFLVPVAVWLVSRLRPAGCRAGVVAAAPAFVLGALPWIVANVGSRLGSLRYGQEVQGTYATRLALFFTKGLPVLFGLHATEVWLVPILFPALYALLLGLVVAALVRGRRHRPVVWYVVVAYPFVFALFPTSWAIGEGRYLLHLLGPLLLLLASMVRTRNLLVAALPLVLAVTLLDLGRIEHRSQPLAVDKLVPVDTGPLRDVLEREGVRYGWADYWIAYRVTFETGERIVVTPDLGAKVRDRRLSDRVQASGQAVRIVIVGSTVDVTVASRYAPVARCVSRWPAGPYLVYARDPAAAGEAAADGTPCPVAAAQFLQV